MTGFGSARKQRAESWETEDMAGMPPQQQSSSQVTGMEMAGLIFLAVFILFSLLWYFAHDLVVFVVLRGSFFLMKPMELIGITSAAEGRDTIRSLAAHIPQVTIRHLLAVANQAFSYYLPIMVAPGLYGIYRAWNDPRIKLRNQHTAQSLLECQAQSFPAITPILHLDLNNENVKGWESSIPPYEFALQNKLIKDGQLDHKLTEEKFRAQIGPKFSIRALRPHEMALAAVFATRLAKDSASAQRLLDDLSRSCAGGKQPDYNLATPLFQKHFRAQCRPFRRVHYYTSTLLCSMFEAAKSRGVISPSFFIWLKPVDRTLWYALNRVSSQVPYTEAAGTWNQWKAEQAAFTGGKTIDWAEFLAPDELTDQPIWSKAKASYWLKETWVRDSVRALESDLIKTGVIR